MEAKWTLRRQMKECLREYTSEALARFSEQVRAALEAHPFFREAQVVLLYCALPAEVDLRPLMERWAGRKEILLPVTEDEGIRLRRYEGAERMRQGRYGIWEPVGPEWDGALEQIDLVVVPGVAFDRGGNRLGHGKGYYDRFLKRLAARRIGVCFPFQLLDEVPHDELDCRMDEVLTTGPTP
ncbi:MAG: 5-formyltetrahydrofolate cyclo-ligase [Bacteroidaceae bacterium]|jgi:5-formyltetrahydrofolate cyclo-ligase